MTKTLYVVPILLIGVTFTSLTYGKKPYSPVILVPGDGGSQIEARLNKPAVVHQYCVRKTNYFFPLWLNFEELAPYIIDCFIDNMKLVYDNVTHTTHNTPGVETRVPGFGITDTVEWLDSSRLSVTTYFHNIAEALVKVGYVRNVTIRGAPYDFRKAPNELKGYLHDLQRLIERTYYDNDHHPVTLIGHSMGNPLALYFLNHMPLDWKEKFIDSLISLAGVWGGTLKPVKIMITGDNLHAPVSSQVVRTEQRSMPSSAWLMPSDEFWRPDEVLVISPHRNYTVNDYKALFTDIDFMDGYYMRQDTENLIHPLRPPDVKVYCLHGVNVKTMNQLQYSNTTWHEGYPIIRYGNGDGTVDIRSLHGCLRWRDQQKPPVYHQTFNNVEHMQILNNEDVIGNITQILLSRDKDFDKY